MSLFAFASISLSILSAGLAIFIFLQARQKTHFVWACFNSTVAIWGLGLFLIGISGTEQDAIFHWRWTFAFNTLIPIFFYHLIHSFCKLKERWLLIALYLEGFSFVPFILFPGLFVKNANLIYDSIYLFVPSPLYYIWLILLAFITLLSFVRLFNFLNKSKGVEKTEGLYLFWGMLLGFVGGFTLALPSIGIPIYPAWHFTICIYAGIITFAILRHHFFNIQFTLTNLLIPIAFFILFIFIFCFIHFQMNLFSLASLSLGIACFLLAYIIACYAKGKMHWFWAFFNVSLGVWGIGTFFVGVSDTYNGALVAWKFAYVGVLLVPILFYHMIHFFCGLENKNFLKFIYLQGSIVILVNILTDYFVGKLDYLFNEFYYHQVTKTYFFFFIIWVSIVIVSFWELYKFIKRSEGIKRTQALYLFWGMLLGFLGGTTVVAPAFGILIYPYGHFFICIYAAISTYAIFKYQLMDIRIAVTRLGVFVVVYSLVLGIPFGLAILGKAWLIGVFAENWFWIPMLTLLALATAGPFIYLFIQRKAEERLLQEQRRYQNTLRQASMGMARVKDLNKLLNLIVHVLSRTVRLEHCSVYLLDGTKGNYILKASRGLDSQTTEAIKEIEENSALIEQLKNDRRPVVYEEINLRGIDTNDERLAKLASNVKELKADVVVPSFEDQNLIALLILGKKKSSEIYSADDLLVFSILADQSALAIENALFYEETGKSLAEQFHEKRLKFLGELGSGVAHQMNNRFNVMTMAAGIGLEEIREKDISTLNKEDLISLVNSNKRILEKVENSALKGKEIAEAIKTYSKASVVPSAVTLVKCVSSSLNLLACKFKIEKLNIKKEYSPNIYVWANLSTLQEVISNAIDNSHDAMRTKEELIRSHKLKTDGYIPQLIIKAVPDNDKLNIEIVDNGIGMTPEQLDKVFVPFFTTKGASKGTGMGLNMMKQLLEKNRGAIAIDSKYEEGTTVTLRVPLATNEQIKEAKEERGGL